MTTQTMRHESKPLRALDPFVHPQLEDYLHQETAFVDRFHALLTDSIEPPFAISVDGLWGSGKTTIMKMLQNRLDAQWRITDATLPLLKQAEVDSSVLERLRQLKIRPGYKDEQEFRLALMELLGQPHFDNYQKQIFAVSKNEEPRFPTFWFNPWEYQKANDIVLAFLQHFAKAVYSRYEQVAMAGAKLLSVLGLMGIDATLKTVSALVKPINLDLSLKAIKDAGELLEKDWNTSYENYDDVMTTIKNEFRALVNWMSGKHDGRPVIIFFDDLDRCLPDTAIQLLEAVKNLFVIPETRVIFVCGIDTHIAKQFIRAHYREIEDTFAINYFRKIFNLTISMPFGTGVYPLLRQHFQTRLGWDDDTANRLANMLATRGRQADMSSVRKYLNVANALYAFQQFNPAYQFDPSSDLVAHLLILKEAWQSLYEELTQEATKDSLDDLKTLIPRVIKMFEDRNKPLSNEQAHYLREYLAERFPGVKLGHELLLRYPALA